MSNIELRDIRFPRENSTKLLRGNIINRSAISSNCTNNKIILQNISYPLASRIFKHTDIEVFVRDHWNFVKNNDMGALHDVYLHYSEKPPVIDADEEKIDDKQIEVEYNVAEDNIAYPPVDLSEMSEEEKKEIIEEATDSIVENIIIEEETIVPGETELEEDAEDEKEQEESENNSDVDYYDYSEENNNQPSDETIENVEESNDDQSSSNDQVIVETTISANNQPNKNNRVYNNYQYPNKHKRKH